MRLFRAMPPSTTVTMLALACAWGTAARDGAAEPDRQPAAVPPRVVLDPLARAIVNSLRDPPPATPQALVEAAITAADVDALSDALDFYRKFIEVVAAMEEGRGDLLADLGERVDPAGLRRLERALKPYEPDAQNLLGSLAAAAGQRRRDPQRLAAAIVALKSGSRSERLAAADQLARCRTDALPPLVDLLQSDDPADADAMALARGLIRELGHDGRDALLAWLGSDDIAHWPGVIAALAASGNDDADFFLAPALAADTPPEVRKAASQAAGATPSVEMARQRLANRLDRLLAPEGLPPADSLDAKHVEAFTWDPQQRRPLRKSLPTRFVRAERALHAARDLAALGPGDPAHVRLVLLARLEMEAVLAGDAPTGLEAIPAERLRDVLAGPDGFDVRMVAEVVDEAAGRGMPMAAAAAARAIRVAAAVSQPDDPAASAAFPPASRDALVRCLSLPDEQVAFEAAMTLAVRGGDPPYRGASHVMRNLLHAATSIGIDRAIIAHPDAAIVEELATGVSRHGYAPTRARSGREAIRAARATADTVLVVLAARLGSPSALETVQLLQSGSDLAAPPVLVVVDPLDDAPRGRFLSRLITSFAETECVAICDRMESLFQEVVDPDSGRTTGPRFSDVLAIAAGPQAAAPERRAERAAARLSRARAALAMLAVLGDRGWDISAAVPTARLALPYPDLHQAAVAVLATAGDPAAQQALFREAGQADLPEDLRQRARTGLAGSVGRYGILLERGDVLGAAARYNRPLDAESRRLAGDLLEILETPRIRPVPARADAP